MKGKGAKPETFSGSSCATCSAERSQLPFSGRISRLPFFSSPLQSEILICCRQLHPGHGSAHEMLHSPYDQTSFPEEKKKERETSDSKQLGASYHKTRTGKMNCRLSLSLVANDDWRLCSNLRLSLDHSRGLSPRGLATMVILDQAKRSKLRSG